MASETVRFGVTLDRKTDGEAEEIARVVERRKKVDFHRALISRVVRLWREKPAEMEQLGIIRRGY